MSTLLYCADVFTYTSRWAKFYGSFFSADSSEVYLCSVLTIISTFIVAFHNSMLIISTSFSSMHINEYKKLLFSYPLASYHVWRRTTTTTITTIIEELFVKNSVNYLLIYYTIFVFILFLYWRNFLEFQFHQCSYSTIASTYKKL